MSSKQEKLAAARRKLKEFQGKNKEVEILRRKSTSDPVTSKTSNENSTDLVIHNSPLITDRENIKSSPLGTQPYYIKPSNTEQTGEGSLKERKTSDLSLNGSKASNLWPEYYNRNDNLVNDTNFSGEKSDVANGLKADHSESHNFGFKNLSISTSKDGSMMLPEKNHATSEMFSFNDTQKLKPVDGKEIFNNATSDKTCLNDEIRPLQMELQNHMQTITILVQQRNDAQSALTEAQTLLSQKSGEAAELNQQVMQLTSSTKNLTQRLADAESIIMKLKLEKEDNLQKLEEMKSVSDKFQAQLEEKEEKFQEIKRKHEEKNTDCQLLLTALKEVQSQVSLYEIQLQQYSAEGHSTLASQVSELKNENQNLNQKILELEKKLESESREKEESSQKFHTYAQQCNSQLNFLNSELKSLKVENDNLCQRNKVLSENLSELESVKEKTFSSESFEREIADLHNQLSALTAENKQLTESLKKKEEECSELESKLDEKALELTRLQGLLKDLEEENRMLANEAETPKANQRLLASMESDKVAAAKAVSQNQKLKEQVVELEKAFMKLSEEKLELTNDLSHEKHVNAELQNLLKNASESKHHDGHDHECHHEDEKSGELVNDSHEIEELRNIVRQLQDDKMELTARLNSYESKRGGFRGEEKEEKGETCEHKHDHEETECENTKLLLQQMEEKVRKTMNEIAVLDEEKEKLEHLVLQLQGETETIGEYITLYQKQRMLLRQRAQEKDIQLMQLSRDKEELKSKLVALDELVQHLIAERENVSTQPVSKSPTANNSSKVGENTAGKIRALINEIGSTTLINNHTIVFEHCSCCSGRLITI